jgi:hypothetical protein
MGRLAVDQAFKGNGLGGALLADALDRAAHAEIAAFALMVDAKDEAAAAFYSHHGFIALPDSSLTLFLPLATVQFFRLLPGLTHLGLSRQFREICALARRYARPQRLSSAISCNSPMNGKAAL